MSTRCSLVIKKGGDTSYAYRHYDGGPSNAGNELKEFLSENKEKMNEWSTDDLGDALEHECIEFTFENACVHGDESYVYILDMDECTLKGYEIPVDKMASENVEGMELVYDETF